MNWFCKHKYWQYGYQPVGEGNYKMFWYFCHGCGMPLPNPSIEERANENKEE